MTDTTTTLPPFPSDLRCTEEQPWMPGVGGPCGGELAVVETATTTRFLMLHPEDPSVVVAYDMRTDDGHGDERVECRMCGAAYAMPNELDYS